MLASAYITTPRTFSIWYRIWYSTLALGFGQEYLSIFADLVRSAKYRYRSWQHDWCDNETKRLKFTTHRWPTDSDVQ